LDFLRPTAEQQYRAWRARAPEESGQVLREVIRLGIGDKLAGMWRSHKRLLEDIRGACRKPDGEPYAIPNAAMRYIAIDAMRKAPELEGWFKIGTPRPRKEERTKRVIVIRELDRGTGQTGTGG
jgi:hypothetical protein